MFCVFHVFSFPSGVYVGTLNLIASIAGPGSILILHDHRLSPFKYWGIVVHYNKFYSTHISQGFRSVTVRDDSL